MGCLVSKPDIPIADGVQGCPTVSRSVLPLTRTISISTPLVHHPSLRRGDSHHLVSLTSTTYGSLLLIDSTRTDTNFRDSREGVWSSSITHETMDTRTGSSKQEDDLRKTLSPDSVINTWELMDGLDDSLLNGEEQSERPTQTIHEKEVTAVHCDDTQYPNSESGKRLSNADDKILIYFTSLRGVRKTYDDCRAVRMIFRGFRVDVNERDISMDSSYKKDLQNKLKGKQWTLPRVFIQGKHVGGAEEIKLLNESGELAKLLEGFPVDDSFGASCVSCGEMRFMPCSFCSGSRKVFDKESKRFRRCMDCNENGLIQCPGCCS